MRCALTLSVALLLAGVVASPTRAAQPVYTGPYPLFTTAVYDLDYAVSTAGTAKQPTSGSETIVSIGLPSGAVAAEAQCAAQVDWFDWDGFPAGLSGPPGTAAGGPINLVAGQTLEFTSSLNTANPFEYPPFTENVFRDTTNPQGSVVPFEGRAEIRVSCVKPVATPLRVDAEVVTVESTASGLVFKYKPINVTQVSGLIGY